jgi:uncharacterized protein YndB with AHSA1/START domain
MSETEADATKKDLVFEYELDAPPEKVWRAISNPAFRDKWLPNEALVSAEPVSSQAGEEVRYSMRESEPPFLESVVTFQVRRNADGGTKLRIIHDLVSARRMPRQTMASDDWPTLMRAA